MKPTEQQKELISKISKEIAGWANTNDINSSSHWNLITEFCESLELEETKESILNNCLDEIMTIIKRTV
jgi:hypothetical protein